MTDTPKKYQRRQATEKELASIQRELRENNEIVQGLAARKKILLSQESQLKNTLKQLIPTSFTVSDHAVLRYIDRHCGFDVEKLRQEICSLVISFADLGEMERNGFRIKDQTVVTFIPSVTKNE